MKIFELLNMKPTDDYRTVQVACKRAIVRCHPDRIPEDISEAQRAVLEIRGRDLIACYKEELEDPNVFSALHRASYTNDAFDAIPFLEWGILTSSMMYLCSLVVLNENFFQNLKRMKAISSKFSNSA